MTELLGDALLRVVIFEQHQGQHGNGDDRHGADPKRFARADERQDRHGEYESSDDARHHHGRNLVEDRQNSALLRIARGERHHHAMAHIVDGVGEREEEIIGDHHPYRLPLFRHIRHKIH